MATVQRASITTAQSSTLFWINVAFGCLLAFITVCAAPALAAFYHEPRLFWVTIVMASSFLFNGASAQHRALLQRRMRFLALAKIDIVTLLSSTAAGIFIAWAGFGYWALIISAVLQPAMSGFGSFMVTRWIPGPPQRGTGVRSMLVMGGTVTLNNVIVYLAWNVDKILIGRFFGAAALGTYGRAYQLINLPTENLNSTLGAVAFPAFSRVQNDPLRLRNYFLKGYGLFLTVVMPITIGCALFSEDIIYVFLGAKWHSAATTFRILSPTTLGFALINPLAWLMIASGRAGRSLKIAFVIAPVVVISYVVGLRGGPNGVAAGFSISLFLLAIPVMLWAIRGTLITSRDLFKAVMTPFISVAVGVVAFWLLRPVLGGVHQRFLRLVLESSVLFGAYFLMMAFAMGKKDEYLDMLRSTNRWPLRRRKG
jgi:PST family polysaccharide transporter